MKSFSSFLFPNQSLVEAAAKGDLGTVQAVLEKKAKGTNVDFVGEVSLFVKSQQPQIQNICK